MTNDVNDQDELVEVKLPKRDYVVLREILEREKTWNWLSKWVKSGFMWVIISGVLTLFAFWDQIVKLFK